ncbi:MAG: polymer-forming cytoskeletal protein [Deltaproteobacteria bacterium]|nr:polymer-forming cytoskeletal protein [Deltaproteobacteria bacterium]
MFGDKDRALRVIDQSPATLLDRGCQFEGKLTFEGSVQINGKFRGEIFSEGTLIIGDSAEIEGKIEIDTVLISGSFVGSIVAKRKIEIHPPATVHGDIITPALVVQEGAVYEGNCSMGKHGAFFIENNASVYEINPK